MDQEARVENGCAKKNGQEEESPRHGDGDGEPLLVVNPILLPEITKIIFSSMARSDLRSARLVSKDWSVLATQEYRRRNWVVNLNKRGSRLEDRVDIFLSLFLTPSPLFPVTWIGFSVDLVLDRPETLVKVLKFIAPWVQCLEIEFLLNQPEPADPILGLDDLVRADELLSHIVGLIGLGFPALEKFVVSGDSESEWTPHQVFALGMQRVVRQILIGAVNLRTFNFNILFDSEDASRQGYYVKTIAEKLPVSLKRLTFFGNVRTFPNHDNEVNYRAMKECNLELQKFEDGRLTHPMEDFVVFLLRQQRTLRKLALFYMERVCIALYPHSPRFDLVTRIGMGAAYNCNFEFFRAFPALLELDIWMLYDTWGWGWDDDEPQEDRRPFNQFYQHPQVRRLLIVDDNWNRVNYQLYSHVFPNLTQFQLTFSRRSDKLTEVFTLFPRLERMKLTWDTNGRYDEDSRLESLLSGVPSSLCEELRNLDISDSGGFAAATMEARNLQLFSVGLANLTKLKVLEIGAGTKHLESILTNVVCHEGFFKMKKLKELRLHEGSPEDWSVGDAGQLVLEALRRRGIDVYRMKIPCLS